MKAKQGGDIQKANRRRRGSPKGPNSRGAGKGTNVSVSGPEIDNASLVKPRVEGLTSLASDPGTRHKTSIPAAAQDDMVQSVCVCLAVFSHVSHAKRLVENNKATKFVGPNLKPEPPNLYPIKYIMMILCGSRVTTLHTHASCVLALRAHQHYHVDWSRTGCAEI